MTWIKPSFRWLTHCNWAQRSGQDRILRVRIRRSGWDRALAIGVLTSPDGPIFGNAAHWQTAFEHAHVHVQWDTERAPRGAALDHYSIQVGLSRHVIREFVGKGSSKSKISPDCAQVVRPGSRWAHEGGYAPHAARTGVSGSKRRRAALADAQPRLGTFSAVSKGSGCPNSQVLGPLGLRACGLPQRPCSPFGLRAAGEDPRWRGARLEPIHRSTRRALLAAARMSSTHAVDAFVVATALEVERALVASGDPEDIKRLAVDHPQSRCWRSERQAGQQGVAAAGRTSL